MRRATDRTTARPRVRTLATLAAGALTVTATAVAVGVGLGTPADTVDAASAVAPGAQESVPTLDVKRLRDARELRVSRAAPRVTLQPEAKDHKYATARLNVWTGPGERTRRVGLVDAGTRLAVTGQVKGHWAEVLMAKHAVRWVNADYLANHKPKPAPKPAPAASTGGSTSTSTGSAPTGISGAPCPDGSAIESGITPNADRVYRAVCAAFPQPTTYGGYDAHGEHADGRAIDIMISGSVGQQIADWLRAHAAELNIRDIIFAQHIWTPERSAEGWRYMSDRGSTTANHYDHVHVAVY